MTPLSDRPERQRRSRASRQPTLSFVVSLGLLSALFVGAIAQAKTDQPQNKEDSLEDVLKGMAERPKEMGEVVSETLLKFIKRDHVSASFQDQEGLKAALQTWVSKEIAAAGNSRTKLGELFHVLESKNERPKILAAHMRPWTARADPGKIPGAASKGQLQDGANLAEWTAAFLSEAEIYARQIIPQNAGGNQALDENAGFGASGAVQEGAKKAGEILKNVGDRIARDDVAGLYGEREVRVEADGAGALDGTGGDKPKIGQETPVPPAPPPIEKYAKAAARGLAVVIVPPLAPVPPVPADVHRRQQARNALLGKIIDNGARREAVVETRRVVRGMLANANPDVLERLVDKNVSIEIIPEGKKLTDVPRFTHLRGKKTFDGRLWEDVRGVSNVQVKGGGHACAVPEEGVLAKGAHGGYKRNFVLIHEYAHMVHRQGLAPKPPDQGIIAKLMALAWGKTLPIPKGPALKEVDDLYAESMRRAEKTGLGDYADSNSSEMFAQATAAYFDVGYLGEDAAKLKKLNERLYDLMNKVYGAPRSLKA